MPDLPTATPESHGLPSAALLTLLDTLGTGLDPHAIVVARHGRVLFEAAWRPYGLDDPALVYSVSKTFTSIAIGLLAHEGRLTLEDGVDRHLDLPNPHGLTLTHLVTMSTGHSREQTLALPFDVAALLTTPPAHAPGTHFAYNSPATYALSAVVTAITGETLTQYLRPRLLDPLGIGERWWKDLGGLEEGFSGFHVTVRDIARLSIALAAGGVVDGAPVIPADYVAAMSRPWSDTRDPDAPRVANGEPDTADHDWAQGYGFQVWRSRRGYRLDGALGQFGVVVPERGIVIAYQGATADAGRTLQAFWDLVDAFSDEEVGAVDETAVEDAHEQLARRVDALDVWDARASLGPELAVDHDTTGWRMTDDGERGWVLHLPEVAAHPGGAVSVSRSHWARTVLTRSTPTLRPDDAAPSPGHLVLAARGEETSDGGVRAHVLVTTSPHRIEVVRASDGTVTARWHIPPLWRPELAMLEVPGPLT